MFDYEEIPFMELTRWSMANHVALSGMIKDGIRATNTTETHSQHNLALIRRGKTLRCEA